MDIHDKIFKAADMLEAEGRPVTLAAIREALGSGSFSTINPILQKWKARKISNSQLPPAPEDLANRMYHLTSELWNQAVQLAESRLVNDRQTFELQINRLREELESLTSEADKALTERGLSAERIKELEASLTAARSELDTAQKRESEADIRYQESERRISDMKSQIEKLDRQNAELNSKNSELANALITKAVARDPQEGKKMVLKPKSQDR